MSRIALSTRTALIIYAGSRPTAEAKHSALRWPSFRRWRRSRRNTRRIPWERRSWRNEAPAPADATVAFETFPSFRVSILGASVTVGVLEIRLRLEMEDPQDRYRLLTKIYLTRRGRGKNLDKLWNYLAVGTASDLYPINR